MSNRLFFVSGGRTIEVNEQPYEQEADLQKLVVDNPNLLAKAWGGDDGRLFLIQREFGIAETENGADTFSLDALLVGEDAIPVLVEVKRSTDTRIRREVVGQMLDYACHAYSWNVDNLRERFEENNAAEDIEAISTDAFWDDVAKNLKAERLRLVFVADKIPEPLRLLIEFIDRNMNGIDIYGAEIQQYKTEGISLLSSNIVGMSAKSQNVASSRANRNWSEEDYENYLAEWNLAAVAPILWNLRDYVKNLGLDCAFCRYTQTPSLILRNKNEYIGSIFSSERKSIGHYCALQLYVRAMLQCSCDKPWDEQRLKSRFNDMPGRAEAEKKGWLWNSPQYINIDLRALLDEANAAYVKEALKEFCDSLVK